MSTFCLERCGSLFTKELRDSHKHLVLLNLRVELRSQTRRNPKRRVRISASGVYDKPLGHLDDHVLAPTCIWPPWAKRHSQSKSAGTWTLSRNVLYLSETCFIFYLQPTPGFQSPTKLNRQIRTIRSKSSIISSSLANPPLIFYHLFSGSKNLGKSNVPLRAMVISCGTCVIGWGGEGADWEVGEGGAWWVSYDMRLF